MDISIVIPAYNEEESLPELLHWIQKVLDPLELSYEIWFVDYGSTDNTWNVMEGLHLSQPTIAKAIKFRRNYGKSAALNTAFHACEGDVVITLDAD